MRSRATRDGDVVVVDHGNKLRPALQMFSVGEADVIVLPMTGSADRPGPTHCVLQDSKHGKDLRLTKDSYFHASEVRWVRRSAISLSPRGGSASIELRRILRPIVEHGLLMQVEGLERAAALLRREALPIAASDQEKKTG